MRVVSLFAGIGGFDLAFERAGMQTMAVVERDANCRKLLAVKFPHAEVHGDVCTASADNLPPCDVLCGGWPCQDLSVAGNRAGLVNGSRSSLFYELTRLIRVLRPRYFIGENVPGLLSSDGGRDFARVLGELGQCGARDVAWRIMDAQYFGVAQRRRRVFIVADFGGERAGEILSLQEGLRGHPAPGREAGARTTTALTRGLGSGGPDDNKGQGNQLVCGTLTPGAHPGSYNGQDAYTNHLVANTLRGEGFDASEDGTWRGTPLIAFSSKDSGADAGELAPTLRSMNYDKSHINGGGQIAIAIQEIGKRQSGTPQNGVGHSNPGDPMFTLQATAQHGVCHKSSVRRLTPRECERLQGFPDDWTAGFSDSVRYRMLGNAVAVPVVEWIARNLINLPLPCPKIVYDPS